MGMCTKEGPRLAVILPAYNESRTMEAVIRDFHAVHPHAGIWVIDNNSSDGTGELAAKALQSLRARGGVIVERSQGKGHALRTAFREIDADVFLLADADLTYSASDSVEILKPVLAGDADMVVGDRLSNRQYFNENKRPFHNFGNRLVLFLINRLFHAGLHDILSGYRAMNSFFVKNYPVLAGGFEIETEMTLHALDKRFKIVERPINYKDRPEGSESKLNTFKDGFRVIGTIMRLMRYYRPLCFFSLLASFFALLGLMAAIPVFADYFTMHYITHVPLAILASSLEVLAMLLFVTGLLLDSSAHFSRFQYEHTLNASPWRRPHRRE